eukprot:7862122-Pyramimonas_sp.AAC.1
MGDPVISCVFVCVSQGPFSLEAPESSSLLRTPQPPPCPAQGGERGALLAAPPRSSASYTPRSRSMPD